MYRTEGKGRRCCLGHRIYSFPCRTSYFAPGWYVEKDELLHKGVMKKRINFTRMIWRKGLIHHILQIVLHGKEMNKVCPPNNSDDLCLLFCINPSSLSANVQITSTPCSLHIALSLLCSFLNKKIRLLYWVSSFFVCKFCKYLKSFVSISKVL